MSVPYHAWTHRPKALGGTDPIEFGAIPWARRSRGFDAAAQVIGTGTFTTLIPNHDYNMGTGESGEAYFQAPIGEAVELVQDAFVTITVEAYWFSAITNRWFLGYSDGSSSWRHGAWQSGTTATDMHGSFSMTHRYSGNTEMEAVVWHSDGANRSLDAFYIEVAVLGAWSGDDFSTMDPSQ